MPLVGDFYAPFPPHNLSSIDYEDPPEGARPVDQLSPKNAEDERADAIRSAALRNLRRTRWLGDFEPMLMTCPLLARKVPPEAMSLYAAAAWRCDGLGFAWECLQATGS